MTRAGVFIVKGGNVLCCYRNGDGYPAGLGCELIDCLDFDNFDLLTLLLKCNLQTMDSIPEDIEYRYIIDLNKRTFTIEKLD